MSGYQDFVNAIIGDYQTEQLVTPSDSQLKDAAVLKAIIESLGASKTHTIDALKAFWKQQKDTAIPGSDLYQLASANCALLDNNQNDGKTDSLLDHNNNVRSQDASTLINRGKTSLGNEDSYVAQMARFTESDLI